MKYTLNDNEYQQKTPGVYDLNIMASVQCYGIFAHTITIKFELTRNCEEGVFNKNNIYPLDVLTVPVPILLTQ